MGLLHSFPLRRRERDEENSSSQFYPACRNGDLPLVRRLLPSMSVEKIDRFENGSTALHAAAYNGHAEIVQLLLEAGASRNLKNFRHNLTAFEEASNEQIRRLLTQVSSESTDRFLGTSLLIEWSLNTREAVQWKSRLSTLLQPNLSLQGIIQYLMDNYLRNHVSLSRKQSREIRSLFQLASKEDNATHLVRAYTSNTSFYKIVNHHLAQYLFRSFRSEPTLGPVERSVAYLTSIFLHRAELQNLSFIGQVYRGLLLSRADLKEYRLDQRLLNKSFLSTSKDPLVATIYAGIGARTQLRRSRDGIPLQFPAICTYQIRNRCTALDISHLSKIPWEQEVLILPLRAFQVRAIHLDHEADIAVQIDLEECRDEDVE